MSPFNPDENERYDEEILDLTVEGFIVVYVGLHVVPKKLYLKFIDYRTGLDIKAKRMTILKPNRGSIARKTAIMGSFEWQDA